MKTNREAWLNMRSLLAAHDPHQETVVVGRAAIFAGFQKYGVDAPFVPRRLSLLASRPYLDKLQASFETSTCRSEADFTRRRHRLAGSISCDQATWSSTSEKSMTLRARTTIGTHEELFYLSDIAEAGLIDDFDIPSLQLTEALRLAAAKPKNRQLVCQSVDLAISHELLDQADMAAINNQLVDASWKF